MPGLRPLFTTLVAGRDYGGQRLTFLLHRTASGSPTCSRCSTRSASAQRLPGILQILGLALGGRFDLPPGSALVGVRRGPRARSSSSTCMLDAIPDVPPNFLQLLTWACASGRAS